VARIARVVVTGIPHHVVQRGNRRESIFFDDLDRSCFLRLLAAYAQRFELELLAYCLMDNHLHLVAVPERADSLARVLKPVNLLYAKHVNTRKGWCGRLWQERFFSCPMDRAHTLAAVRYVERNPVRAGMVRRAELYAWSSAAAHCGERNDILLSDRHGWLDGVENWTEWLGSPEDTELADRLRLHTRTGRPLGGAAFVLRVERSIGRHLRPRPAGRKKGERNGGK
jgi:putative transposase